MNDIAEGCVIALFVLLMIAGVLFGTAIRFSEVGTGSHTGYVTAVDERGYIWVNYDVYFKTDNSSSQEDLYCVFRDDKELAEKLRSASKTGERITIDYKGVRGIGFGLCKHTQINGITTDEQN